MSRAMSTPFVLRPRWRHYARNAVISGGSTSLIPFTVRDSAVGWALAAVVLVFVLGGIGLYMVTTRVVLHDDGLSYSRFFLTRHVPRTRPTAGIFATVDGPRPVLRLILGRGKQPIVRLTGAYWATPDLERIARHFPLRYSNGNGLLSPAEADALAPGMLSPPQRHPWATLVIAVSLTMIAAVLLGIIIWSLWAPPVVAAASA
ncbi:MULTISPECIES: hypothetical protein [unclassified Frigoribacterium]|uniref:hypothetical protein n=1 Tax=unclassified Frigoribacterium TaxID=2627005 RepID=UPI0015631657|nr:MULTISPECIES: hypothetical protein [unclassified Frigoribacterium]NQW87864.1 hypothetical protein [Frigoribacterium sp. VKM Ac-2860]NQX09327.1 hypothetical protein [Frigoribacterium sp. VKM Ac-2859]